MVKIPLILELAQTTEKRLNFIDAVRAWAIIMMLQGHFIDGLLSPVYKDKEALWYAIWTYFRGITAPVFFTASGLIFTYLLFKRSDSAYVERRVLKGLKRGIELLILGYLLRLNVPGFLNGHLYPSFFYVDVLHCIGIAILTLILLYKLLGRWFFNGFAWVLFLLATLIFSFEPAFKRIDWSGYPLFFSHYFSRENGSLFTVIPWVGYSLYGAFLAMILVRQSHKKWCYPITIVALILMGVVLKYYSSSFLIFLNDRFGWEVLKEVAYNNYLFIRLGDVFWVLAVFILGRKLFHQNYFLAIGQNTLSIYVIHSIILYGSFHGFGLYRFFKHSLDISEALFGATLFIIACVALSFAYVNRKGLVKDYISRIFQKK